jgi:hypothetical protein
MIEICPFLDLIFGKYYNKEQDDVCGSVQMTDGLLPVS